MQRLGGDSMNDKKIITEHFANDDTPAMVTDIEAVADMGEHYYKVTGTDENGEFETTVFVDGSLVLIVPE